MGFTIYYGSRRFLLATPSFALERMHQPHRHLMTTLLIARKAPFHLELADGTSVTANAALVAPKIPRRRLIAQDSDLIVLGMPIQSPEFIALQPVFGGASICVLNEDRISALRDVVDAAAAGVTSEDAMKQLFFGVAERISGNTPKERRLDTRVVAAMTELEQLPLCDVSLDALARRCALSASRLRHLFKDELGTTVGHFARWIAVWRAALLWKRGLTLTEIAHAAGFHDLSHMNRSFGEVFGFSPSVLIDRRAVTLVRCS